MFETCDSDTILTLLAIAALIWLMFFKDSNKKVDHFDDATEDVKEEPEPTPKATYMEPPTDIEPAAEQTVHGLNYDSVDGVVPGTEGKFDSNNMAKNGYKKDDYRNGKRSQAPTDRWDTMFDNANNLMLGQTGENSNFKPFDESGGNLASYKGGNGKCGSNQDCEPEDLFNSNNYLPQEVNKDWFEVMKDPVAVKNRHLINVTRPIGVDTVGTSHKNSSYDLRQAPPNPKFVVSPWLQSAIEPDTNIKAFY